MAESVARLINVVGVAPETALRMAITVPARVINAPRLAQILGRNGKDILILDRDWQVTGTCA
jgi:N-acetylglucosamine-6-phosphate deacetylase